MSPPRDSLAHQVAPETHWPELRVLVLVVSGEKKQVGSTAGMQTSVDTSPLLKVRAPGGGGGAGTLGIRATHHAGQQPVPRHLPRHLPPHLLPQRPLTAHHRLGAPLQRPPRAHQGTGAGHAGPNGGYRVSCGAVVP
uniref:Mvd1 C-terminal domain-containing protein n=1 Tax=Strix occidentalis caurina TaxID=311401 RepID=A0A8D0F7W5_STROC